MTIDDIIAAAVSHLRSLPDGTEISTSEALAAACGFNIDPEGEYLVGDVQIDFKGMFELDQNIRKAARKAGLALDDSAYADSCNNRWSPWNRLVYRRGVQKGRCSCLHH